MIKERYTQVLISFLIAGTLFATGFYAGQKDSAKNQSAQFLNATSTSVDMASFLESLANS